MAKVSWHRAMAMLSGRTLHHGSVEEFGPGTVLEPQPGGYATLPDEDIAGPEAALERHRPPGMIPRAEAVFMVDDPDTIDAAGGYDDHVYEVRPVGPAEASDMAWYSEMSVYWSDLAERADEDEIRRLAEGYWSGEPFPDRSRRLFEYRARGAVVEREVEP